MGIQLDYAKARGLLTTKEVCQLLGDISVSTLWHLTKAGRFPQPTDRFGGRKFWHEDVVVKWIEEARNGTAA